jgi:hypothetical protein
MVAIDKALNKTPGGRKRRWQHPRLLLSLSVIALGLSVNAVVSGGSFGIGLPPQSGGEATMAAGSGFQGAGNGNVALVTPAAAENREQFCRRVSNIVQTACGLRQRDRDAEGIRLCTVYELKYTLWSAYGCR